MKLKNIILIIMITVLLVLTYGCLPIYKAHNERIKATVCVSKTEDGIGNVFGFGRYEYKYTINRSGNIRISIEIYDKGKLLKNEFIDRWINVESNKKVNEKIEISILENEKSGITWQLEHGEESIVFTTENFIKEYNSRQYSITSEAYLNENDRGYLIEYTAGNDDNSNKRYGENKESNISYSNEIKNEPEIKEQIISNKDFVFFVDIGYQTEKGLENDK